jgi:hypothetical protein
VPIDKPAAPESKLAIFTFYGRKPQLLTTARRRNKRRKRGARARTGSIATNAGAATLCKNIQYTAHFAAPSNRILDHRVRVCS